MKAPFCDLCKHAHWRHEQHVWGEVDGVVRPPVRSTQMQTTRDREKYNAYMRAYRLKKKLGG